MEGAWVPDFPNITVQEIKALNGKEDESGIRAL